MSLNYNVLKMHRVQNVTFGAIFWLVNQTAVSLFRLKARS